MSTGGHSTIDRIVSATLEKRRERYTARLVSPSLADTRILPLSSPCSIPLDLLAFYRSLLLAFVRSSRASHSLSLYRLLLVPPVLSVTLASSIILPLLICLLSLGRLRVLVLLTARK